jgi:hypothetical protein
MLRSNLELSKNKLNKHKLKSTLLGNRFLKSILKQNRFSSKVDFGEGLSDFYRIQRIRVNSKFISSIFKNTKIFFKII